MLDRQNLAALCILDGSSDGSFVNLVRLVLAIVADELPRPQRVFYDTFVASMRSRFPLTVPAHAGRDPEEYGYPGGVEWDEIARAVQGVATFHATLMVRDQPGAADCRWRC